MIGGRSSVQRPTRLAVLGVSPPAAGAQAAPTLGAMLGVLWQPDERCITIELLTQHIRERLIHNGMLSIEYVTRRRQEPDFLPVVKLFTPDGACTWLLTELDPNDQDIAFGLCDLGMGFPELGSVRLSELKSVRGNLGLPVERDQVFRPCKTLSAYAEEARLAGAIKA